VSGTITAQ